MVLLLAWQKKKHFKETVPFSFAINQTVEMKDSRELKFHQA